MPLGRGQPMITEWGWKHLRLSERHHTFIGISNSFSEIHNRSFLSSSGVSRIFRPRGQSPFRPLHPASPWEHTVDAKSELRVKSRQELIRAAYKVISGPFWKLRITSRIWRQGLSNLEIINYSRIVSREAIPTLKLRSQLNIQTVALPDLKLR